MRIFISWSGVRSRALATILKTWLGDVLQEVDLWMSEHDIEAGARWGQKLNESLGGCNFGVLCLTPENLTAPWILFEAGALSKAFDTSKVIPYRLDVAPTEIAFPLAQFQNVAADQAGTLKMLQSINTSRDIPIPSDRLQRLFDKWWPDLEKDIAAIPRVKATSSHQRKDRDILDEILLLVRQQQFPTLGSLYALGSNDNEVKSAILSLLRGTSGQNGMRVYDIAKAIKVSNIDVLSSVLDLSKQGLLTFSPDPLPTPSSKIMLKN